MAVHGLFRREVFVGFGPCGLSGVEAPLFSIRARRARKLRQAVREHGPRLPGVYGMLDVAGELIYVGKARSLRNRLFSYFRPSRDEKAERIIRETRGLVWEVADSEFAALLRELELIRRWQPRFNVQGQPRRHRRCYVCLGRRPAPYAFAIAKPPRNALACFGPVPGIRRAREAARRLNDWYRLRDCPQKQPMIFADQRELFPLVLTPGCIRHDIGNCLGPCAAACTQPDYAFNVQAARDFLEGRDSTPLEVIERDMNTASAALQFERAAELRDRLDSLRWLSRHLERLRQAVRHSFVYPVPGHDGGLTWYLVREGLVRAAVPPGADEAGRHHALTMLEDVFRSGVAVGGPTGLEEVDGVLLVAGWFARHRDERLRVLEPAVARQSLLTAPG
jgi:excinuclease ABC subunit C